MEISRITPYVITVLKENGWHEGRKYDIGYFRETLCAEGYVLFEYAQEILESLGGITVHSKGDGSHSYADFDFDPVEAASGEFDRIEYYQSIAHESLFPLGSLSQGIAYAGMSQKIYWGSVDQLYLVGNSIEDYLNNLLSWRPSIISLN